MVMSRIMCSAAEPHHRSAWSPLEEEFFREGDRLAESGELDELATGDEGPTWWHAVVSWLRGWRAPQLG